MGTIVCDEGAAATTMIFPTRRDFCGLRGRWDGRPAAPGTTIVVAEAGLASVLHDHQGFPVSRHRTSATIMKPR